MRRRPELRNNEVDTYFVDCLRQWLGLAPLYPERWIEWKRVPWSEQNDREIGVSYGVKPETVRAHRRLLGEPACRKKTRRSWINNDE